jgi:hypothetical protein
MTETSEDAEAQFERAAAQGIALKHAYPATSAESRRRDAELIKQHAILVSAARQVITSNRVNGANGHALEKTEQAHGLTKEERHGLAKAWVTFLAERLREVARELGKEFAVRDKRSDALEKRIAVLEVRPVLEDGDIWSAEKLFKPGQVVTCDGSAWVCRELNSNARPGQSDCWRLWVKRGRDGRDAKGK